MSQASEIPGHMLMLWANPQAYGGGGPRMDPGIRGTRGPGDRGSGDREGPGRSREGRGQFSEFLVFLLETGYSDAGARILAKSHDYGT